MLSLGAMWKHMPGAAALRRRALEALLRPHTLRATLSRYQGLSPVSGILNTLAIGVRAPHSDAAVASRQGVEAWRWEDEADGVRYAGARSTSWDTSLAMAALLAVPHAGPETRQALRQGYRRLAAMQMTEELAGGQAERRDPILGGWCLQRRHASLAGERLHGRSARLDPALSRCA